MKINKEFWLLFCNGNNFISNNFLKRGFGHIKILSKENNKWMLIDPSFNFLNIRLLDCNSSIDLPKIYLKKNLCYSAVRIEKIIDLNVNSNKEIVHSLIPRFVSCVSFVKYAYDIKVRAFTPYQLFMRLYKMSKQKDYTLKNGFKSVNWII